MPDTVLPLADWQRRADAHAAAVAERTRGHLARRDRHEKHPIEDFLWEYYSFTPARLSRWHPGPGVGLAGATGMPRAGWRHYHSVGDVVTFDADSFVAARGRTVDFVRDLLEATLSRPATLGCFGLHEWAMVHGIPEGGVRHENWPLRLGATATDEVTRSHTVRCSHFDAFRFFTDSGRPLNTLTPSRETQVDHEQPGCLHAGMDVYKWCFKLEPLVPSDLVLDAFDLAREIRLLDMQASPYDLSALEVEPVPIETPEGKAEYVARQRNFSERSNALRRRLLTTILELRSQTVAPATERDLNSES